MGRGNKSLYEWSRSKDQAYILVKTFKNLLQNLVEKSDLETLQEASMTGALQMVYNDALGRP